MAMPPVKSELGSRPAVDTVQAYERERDRDASDAAPPLTRSYSIPWLPKVHASLASMELWSTQDTPLLPLDEQWRWHTVSNILAESYSVFDAHLDNVVQGFRSTIWNCRGTCPIHRKVHGHNRWALINTPGFKHTTKFRCFHDGKEFLIPILPF